MAELGRTPIGLDRIESHRGDAILRFKLPSYIPMITIYHNPRCSKSRGALDLVETVYRSKDEPIQIVEYLKQPPSVEQLSELHRMLGCPAREMVRTNEKEYGDLGLDHADTSDRELFDAITKHPILLQRPIVVRDGRAVIGRPPENVGTLFE
jgi:arsenate reductase